MDPLIASGEFAPLFNLPDLAGNTHIDLRDPNWLDYTETIPLPRLAN